MVTKITIDFDDYEGREYEEYQGEDPRPGTWLNAEVVRATHQEDDEQISFVCKVVDHPDYEGWTRIWYANYSGDRKWKAQEMIRALTGQEKPVTLDWDNEKAVAAFLKKARKIRIQTGEYNDRINIRKVRPLLNAVPGTGTAKAAPPKAAPAPEPEPVEEELSDYTAEELEEMDTSELEEIVTEEFEGELPKKPARDRTGSKYKEALVDAILELQGEDEEETESEAEGDSEEEEFEDGFEDAGDADEEEEEEEEPEPEPAPRARRSRATAAKAAPAPAKATTRRRRG